MCQFNISQYVTEQSYHVLSQNINGTWMKYEQKLIMKNTLIFHLSSQFREVDRQLFN